MQRLHAGLMLGGRYELVRLIAAGGMGEVWETLDVVLKRTVAAKVMSARSEEDTAFLSRFRIEAQHAAGLSHPNIAMVFDYGDVDDLSYLIMELVDGETLAAILKARGRLDPATVRSVISQAALGIAAAHEARVVHRDIKPANIMVTRSGLVKLTDFGIARALDAVGHTKTGEIIGTPHYLSPEQGQGRRATESSDLYSLGVVAYELLMGERPFVRDSQVAVVLAHLQDPPPPLPAEVPEDLRHVIEQCLAKEPGQRPPSARQLAAELGVTEATTHWSAAISTVRDTGLGGGDGADTGTSSLPTPITPTLMVASPLLASVQNAWVTPHEQLRDLEELLAGMKPRLNEGAFALVSIREHIDGLTPYMSLLEPEGLTLLLPVEQATEHALEFELPLAWLTLDASRSVGTQGWVQTLTTALAQARIASVAGAGRWHTHLFVPHHQGEQALKVLRRLSRAHQDED